MRYLLFYIILIIVCGYGYISNIINVIGLDMDGGVTIQAILQIGGIFAAPLGVIMGYVV